MNYLERQQKVLRECGAADAVILISEAKNIRYLSGFSGSSGWLLLTPDSHYILTDGRYWDQVARQCPQAKLLKFEAPKHESLSKATLTFLSELQLGSHILLETDQMTLAVYRQMEQLAREHDVRVTETENLCKPLRTIKDDKEIELLEKAARIADSALAAALKDFGPGRSELQLKAELEYQILQAGGQGASFSTIVASGPNGSYPHAGASDRIVGEGELITIDFGAVYGGYCSDMTRTIWYGELPEQALRLIKHTREAQQAAVDAVKAGLTCRELDQVARGVLQEAGLGEYFVHSLGHGVGLDVHEDPGVRSTNETVLKANQVITIEPGVYVPGFSGCRVEDTVVVTDHGCRVLNLFPKQPLGSSEPTLPG